VRPLTLCFVVLVAGCASVNSASKCAGISQNYINERGFEVNDCPRGPRIERPTLRDLVNLPMPRQKAVVSVYSFLDLTGQRATTDNMALFSTAVTQGADSFLIDALLAAGGGTWFLVAERGNLDALTRERQLIISTRKSYDGEGANKLAPLLFSGLILTGGITGYDANAQSGGIGARYLGIGLNTQYRVDEVTVALRAVLVQTGQVLLNVITSKRVYSASTGFDTFRFTENGTELVELEAGIARNETATYATRSAIEAAVYALVIKGIEDDLWDYKPEQEASNAIPSN
jgi:curli production assembly/transport component CsgG